MYFSSNSRRISRQPELMSSAALKSETTYTKSAGLNIERSREPIKNAINAAMMTVDSGYVGAVESEVDRVVPAE